MRVRRGGRCRGRRRAGVRGPGLGERDGGCGSGRRGRVGVRIRGGVVLSRRRGGCGQIRVIGRASGGRRSSSSDLRAGRVGRRDIRRLGRRRGSGRSARSLVRRHPIAGLRTVRRRRRRRRRRLLWRRVLRRRILRRRVGGSLGHLLLHTMGNLRRLGHTRRLRHLGGRLGHLRLWLRHGEETRAATGCETVERRLTKQRSTRRGGLYRVSAGS